MVPLSNDPGCNFGMAPEAPAGQELRFESFDSGQTLQWQGLAAQEITIQAFGQWADFDSGQTLVSGHSLVSRQRAAASLRKVSWERIRHFP